MITCIYTGTNVWGAACEGASSESCFLTSTACQSVLGKRQYRCLIFLSGILKAYFPWRSPEGPAFWEPYPLGTEFLGVLSSGNHSFWRSSLLRALSLATLPPDSPISRGSTFWRLHLVGVLLPEIPKGFTFISWYPAGMFWVPQWDCHKKLPLLGINLSLLPSSLWVFPPPCCH